MNSTTISASPARKLFTLLALLGVSVFTFAIDWSGYEWLGNGGVDTKYNSKIKAAVSPDLGTGFINNLQKKGTHDAIHIAMPSADFGAFSLDAADYTLDGAGFFPHLSAFTKQENTFTVVCSGTTYTFTIYYADGEPDDLTGWNLARNKTSVAGHNAEDGHAAANDGNTGTRWGSNGAQHYAAVGDAAEDWWYVDLGDFYQINTIKILFETASPTDYDILISNNAASWTVIGTYTDAPKTGNNPATDYNEYNFTDKVGRYVKIFARNGYLNMLYGFSMYEFEVYGEHASLEDHNPPTMTSAELSGEAAWNQVHLAVAGTDTEDGTVVSFHVTDATNGVDQVCAADAGIITVTDLSGETEYNLTVKAVDVAGNESAEGVVVNVTTPIDTSVPLVAAPTPSGTNKEIRPIYSDAFASILEHSFDKDGFAGMPLYLEKNFNGDNCLIYDRSGSAQTFVTWGMYNDGSDAIIAQSEYRAAGKMGVDASEMEYLHIDIWSLQACNTILIRINDGERTGSPRLSHDGNGWKSYDLPLSEFADNANTDNVRWFKFEAFDAITGKVAIDNVYFWKAASGLSSVSATSNNSTMGTATVKQNGVSVTEVTTGTEVTFSAVANEGYIFVNWSNGETAATFNATVDASMNLTANFRQLGTTYCNTEMTSGDYTAYVTYKKTANENEYTFIVRSAQVMTGFSNAYVGHINGDGQTNMKGLGTLSGNGHMLSYTFTSSTTPKMNSPLYVNFANYGEVTFNGINTGSNVEFALPCEDPEITAIELNKTEATLDLGNTLTLVPTFTPAYMSADITWETSDETKATVANGVVTPVAPGSVTITAKVSETIKATCAITVQASTSHNWYGYGTSQDLDYTYRLEYTTDHHIVAHVKRQGDKTGLVDVGMNINNVWTTINVTEGEEAGWKKGTTEATYTTDTELNIILQSNWAGPSSIINIPYTVGADNEMPTIVPSVLKLSNDAITMGLTDDDEQLTVEIHHRDAANQTITWSSDDETVATVVNGLVHPVGVGSTTIHASTHNNVSATCEVTVVGALEPTTYWGNGASDGVAIAYSITRNANHTLTYAIEALQDKVGFFVQVNDGEYHTTTLNDGIYSWTSTATYTDGATLNGFFYAPFDGGAAHIDFQYTVGSTSERQAYIPITFNDQADDDSWIAANDGQTRDVAIARPMTANDNAFKTICFPFAMTQEQIALTFGDCEILQLSEARMKSADEMYVRFAPVASIEAGKPYLITLLGDNKAALDFSGVTINSSTANNEIKISAGDGKYISMIGTFTSTSISDENDYYLDTDNYLHSSKVYYDYSGNQVSIRAFRCFFRFSGFPQGQAPARAQVVRHFDVATDRGQTVTPAAATKQLINGQIVIIRDGVRYTATGLKVD